MEDESGVEGEIRVKTEGRVTSPGAQGRWDNVNGHCGHLVGCPVGARQAEPV